MSHLVSSTVCEDDAKTQPRFKKQSWYDMMDSSESDNDSIETRPETEFIFTNPQSSDDTITTRMYTHPNGTQEIVSILTHLNQSDNEQVHIFVPSQGKDIYTIYNRLQPILDEKTPEQAEEERSTVNKTIEYLTQQYSHISNKKIQLKAQADYAFIELHDWMTNKLHIDPQNAKQYAEKMTYNILPANLMKSNETERIPYLLRNANKTYQLADIGMNDKDIILFLSEKLRLLV